jgi:hypothetical protein
MLLIVFARPETGKTAFWVSLVSSSYGFAEQGAKVHAFINEEPAVRTQMRAISCFTGLNKEQIVDDIETAHKEWIKIKDNIKMIDTVREIAKRRQCVVIAISQASAEAHNRDHISFDMMENSKTGKAAEADLIIGIGNRASNDPTNNSRILNVSKNKITGWHGDPSCLLDKYISRFTD